MQVNEMQVKEQETDLDCCICGMTMDLQYTFNEKDYAVCRESYCEMYVEEEEE